MLLDTNRTVPSAVRIMTNPSKACDNQIANLKRFAPRTQGYWNFTEQLQSAVHKCGVTCQFSPEARLFLQRWRKSELRSQFSPWYSRKTATQDCLGAVGRRMLRSQLLQNSQPIFAHKELVLLNVQVCSFGMEAFLFPLLWKRKDKKGFLVLGAKSLDSFVPKPRQAEMQTKREVSCHTGYCLSLGSNENPPL